MNHSAAEPDRVGLPSPKRWLRWPVPEGVVTTAVIAAAVWLWPGSAPGPRPVVPKAAIVGLWLHEPDRKPGLGQVSVYEIHANGTLRIAKCNVALVNNLSPARTVYTGDWKFDGDTFQYRTTVPGAPPLPPWPGIGLAGVGPMVLDHRVEWDGPDRMTVTPLVDPRFAETWTRIAAKPPWAR